MTAKEFERISIGDAVESKKGKRKWIVKSKDSDNGIVRMENGEEESYKNLKPVVEHRVVFDSIFGYDPATERWIYDSKYYLHDGWWYYMRSTRKAMQLSQEMIEDMRSIMAANRDLPLKDPLES